LPVAWRHCVDKKLYLKYHGFQNKCGGVIMACGVKKAAGAKAAPKKENKKAAPKKKAKK